jgi:hypothetical protein
MRLRSIVRVAIGVVLIGLSGLGLGTGLAALGRWPVRVVARLRSSYPNFTRLQAVCPPRWTLTGGGAEALGNNSVLNTSIPNDTRTGWIAVADQPGYNSVGLHVFAVCARDPEQGTIVRVVARLRSSYPNFTRLQAVCPPRWTLTGGGAEALGNDSVLNTSIPNDSRTGWIAVGHQPGDNSVGLHVFAVCSKNPERGTIIRVVARLRSSYPNFTRLQAVCPAGWTLAGGGAEALGNNSILNTSIPNDTRTGWIAVAHQPGYNSVGLHVFALCAAGSDDPDG